MSNKPASPHDIPVLTEVVASGQKAARGQTSSRQRRATDPNTDDDASPGLPFEEPLEHARAALELDARLDSILDKYTELLRQELREEFGRLLEELRQRDEV